ncbi:MAG: hypothetical protein RMZ43_020895 [Nostoc sp. CmiVER01]|uniref:hypothetical protein n=1 Tax=Nostoc sp. CmiVER01 TaxID=3075384 RepID=UPI002AD2F991|nr:hypothetical protein [Nostoc sp. CmiVER01]
MSAMSLTFLEHILKANLDELQENLREVIKMLVEDENLVFETEFVGTQQIVVY